ncbi:MAG: hypothetical protein P4M08_15475 [Oligoflexia bacterium]|nr:hypothetical protein [Oligoflexia bacterium]
MSLWLIRNQKNQLLGPVEKDELIAQIRAGQLGLNDEVCAANHYWIHLDERDEVAAHLGIEMPRMRLRDKDGEEITLTDTAEIAPDKSVEQRSAPLAESPAGEPPQGTEPEGSTVVAPGSFVSAPPSNSAAVQQKPMVVGRAEGMSLLGFGALLLVLMTGGFVFWILKVLHS